MSATLRKGPLAPRAVRYGDAVLPAKHLRFCGTPFQDDAYYLASAKQEANRLVTHFGLARSTRVLDVGCGSGRLPIGLLSVVGEVEHYRGLDVSRPSIRWCERYLARVHPGLQFVHLDVQNERYNPRGEPLGPGFRFPFRDGEFHVIYAYSVFSHMEARDIETYVREIHRVAGPGGRLFFTAFAEESVPEVTVNPEGYRQDWGGQPLHCVRYNRQFLDGILAANGFAVDAFAYEAETNGQSGYYASVRTPGR